MGFKKLLTCISNVLHFKSENFRLSSFSAKKKKKLSLKITLKLKNRFAGFGSKRKYETEK